MARSWDLWDTLIVRCVLTPVEVFEIVEERTSYSGFARARTEAEVLSRAEVKETSLRRIYDYLATDGASRRRLMDEESAVEAALVSPIAANIRAFRSSDVILSDMYLGSEQLLDLLRKCGLEVSRERLFVSCEHGATKSAGALFRLVMKQTTLEVHRGDNLHSDVSVPRALGLQAKHYRGAELSARERGWQAMGKHEARLAGVARAARLAAPTDDENETAEWTVFSQCVAPLLVGFVSWVMGEATARGISRLRFLSRDGQILHRVAQSLAAARGTPVEMRYTYASRQALHLPGHESMTTTAEWLFADTAYLSIEVIARRLAVETRELQAALGRFLKVDPTANLSAADRETVRRTVLDPEMASVVRRASERVFPAARDYLRREGFLDRGDGSIGIIDVGWNGRMQRSLEAVVRKAGGDVTRIHGFYLSVAPSCVFPTGERVHGYLSDPFLKEKCDHWPNRHRAVLEHVLSADHAGVAGYEFDSEGRGKPVLGPAPSAAALTTVRRRQEAIMAFVERFCAMEQLVGPGLAGGLSKVEGAFRQFVERPSRAEAIVFKDENRSEQQVESHHVPLVRHLSFRQAVHRQGRNGWGLWPEGSFAISGLSWLQTSRRVLQQARRFMRACLEH
jgi:FMN phosphatase YigB (HAD superfamily)